MTIGENVVIADAAVVTKDVLPNTVVSRISAKVRKVIKSKDSPMKESFFD